MTTTFRVFVEDDYEAALDLWKRCEGMGLSAADDPCAFKRFLARNPETCFVAVEGELVIGTVLGGSDGRRGYLYHLAVDPAQRKRGIGKALVERCLAAMQAAGIQKCHLMVMGDNLSGQDFWAHEGWQPRSDIVLMSKDIVNVKEAGQC